MVANSKELANKDDVAETSRGTPQYQAPEFIGRGAYDAKVDVWALGVVVYEMFHRHRMFSCK